MSAREDSVVRGRGGVLLATLVLFLVWSNTFLAFEVLLRPAGGAVAPMTWLDLSVARFVPVFPICAAYCFLARRRESVALVKRHPLRLAVCALTAVPVYSLTLYYGMQHGVSGPVASLLTTMSPLYLVLIGAAALRERISGRKVAGLVLGFGGVALVASGQEGGGAEGGSVAAALVAAVAPLAWAVYSALTKPVMRDASPALWTYLVLTFGAAPLIVLTPFAGGPAMARLDATEWALLLYLSLAATVFGNAVWSFLLRRLPASTTGFTVFLNPPLTTASKRVLSWLLPASFTFSIAPIQWVGGALALVGVGLVVLGGARREGSAEVARRRGE
jgi:drug/metabolite transporter (DMT)-like permease